MAWVFDIKDTDVYWCTADIGWITGHSYIAYGPLCLGATSMMYEGSPDYPDFGSWFQIIEEYGVSVIYTAPTAIRMFMNEGPYGPRSTTCPPSADGLCGRGHEPRCLRMVAQVCGQRIAPIMDTWFQSETGSQVIAPLPITPLKPGSPVFPLPGSTWRSWMMMASRACEVPGNIVMTTPWPSMLRQIYKDPRPTERLLVNLPWQVPLWRQGQSDSDGYIWAWAEPTMS